MCVVSSIIGLIGYNFLIFSLNVVGDGGEGFGVELLGRILALCVFCLLGLGPLVTVVIGLW